MGTHRIVVFEPAVELPQHGGGVGAWVDVRIVALEGFDNGFGHSVIRHDDFGALVSGHFVKMALW